MATTNFSGQEIISVLEKHNFVKTNQSGSHVKLKYRNSENPSDKRTVIVPLHDEISVGTLNNISKQAGARDFQSFCEWIQKCK